MSDILTAKVAGVNRAHLKANELYEVLVPIFTPLVGKQIFKSDGTLLKKYKELLPQLPCTSSLCLYKHVSDYFLGWTVKTCELVPPHGCTYYEAVLYVGEVKGGVLTRIMSAPNFRTDFTVEEVQQKRECYTTCKKAADDAFSALYPFGEYDRQ